jgi:hypothetical protein
MTNPVRGEVSLTLAGKPIVLRPTWEAIIATESAWGCGWPEIVQRLQRQQFRLSEVASLICEGVKAAGDDRFGAPTVAQVGQKLIEHGALQDDVVDGLVKYVMGPLYDFERAAEGDPARGKPEAETPPSA